MRTLQTVSSRLGGLVLAGMVLTGPLLTGPVLAQDATRSVITDVELQGIVQNAGYKAKIDEDDNGPFITSGASGQTFYIGLYGCDEAKPKSCNILSFLSSSYPTSPDIAAKVSEWNDSQRWWSRIMLDKDKQPALIYNVSILGGVTDAHIEALIADFVGDLDEFTKLVAN